MLVEKAKKHYLGEPGYQKFNCAQAILNAFKEKFNISPECIEQFKATGGGRAPDGQCGALYAAKYIVEKTDPAKMQDFENALRGSAGSITCREIRALRKLPCVGCVEKIAECLEQI